MYFREKCNAEKKEKNCFVWVLGICANAQIINDSLHGIRISKTSYCPESHEKNQSHLGSEGVGEKWACRLTLHFQDILIPAQEPPPLPSPCRWLPILYKSGPLGLISSLCPPSSCSILLYTRFKNTHLILIKLASANSQVSDIHFRYTSIQQHVVSTCPFWVISAFRFA